ncbi:MAG: hypothetical protein AAFU61_14710, partial [Pseudomonadota bacterium]
MSELLSRDGQWVVLGDVILQNNTWGRRDLRNGEDFSQTIEYGRALSDGVRMDWDWPEPEVRRVLAYPEVIAGRKPWLDATAGETLPVRVEDAGGVTAAWALDWGGETDGFNVAFDLWLTTEAAGDEHTIANEIMIWLKPHDGRPAGRQVMEVEIEGTVWDLWVKDAPHGGGGWSYAAFVAQGEMAAGEIDLGALLAALDAVDPLDEGLWLSAVELGAEVIGGAGWMEISDFEVRLGEAAAAPAQERLGTSAAERMATQGGDDLLRGRDGDDSLEAGAGDDAAWGGSGDDQVWGGVGDDRVHGGEGADRVFGGAGADRAFGDAGDDALFGGQGADHLDGARGADRIDGGAGADFLRGGPGADVFVIAPGGVDRIGDFSTEDRIVLVAGNPADAVLTARGRGAALEIEGEAMVLLPNFSPHGWTAAD